MKDITVSPGPLGAVSTARGLYRIIRDDRHRPVLNEETKATPGARVYNTGQEP